MFTKKDQKLLENVYSSMTSYPVSPAANTSKPVILSMDMPMPVSAETHDSECDCQCDDHNHEHDYSEIEMAVSQLNMVSTLALKLKELISSAHSLEGWEAAKITKAADYINAVYSNREFSEDEHEEVEMFTAGAEDTHCPYAAQGCKCGGCSECK
jgi:hypothetical protein